MPVLSVTNKPFIEIEVHGMRRYSGKECKIYRLEHLKVNDQEKKSDAFSAKNVAHSN
jgi:hypothetical protein